MREIQEDLLTLGSMVDKAIDRAITALQTQNESLAEQVVHGDEAINDKRWQIEESTLHLIATQSPMAGDLRRILASVHIATNLERMGDHAEGISKLTLRTSDNAPLKPLVDLPLMAEKGRAMLHDALEAFVDGDADRARDIAARDQEIDHLYQQVYNDLLTFMIADPGTTTRATHLLWVAHNLERIGDRSTNICERIIFAVTGRFEEVNPKDFSNALFDAN